MAKYTFNLQAELVSLKPYAFYSNYPGDGALNQYLGGMAMKAAFGKQELPVEDAEMSVGLRDWYGKKVFNDIILYVGDDSFEFINALLTVERKQNIVTTPIQGRSGSVVEFISNASFTVNINGSIISSTNSYPKSEIMKLASLLEKMEVIDVVSEYLNMFKIYQLINVTCNFSQIVASENYQSFSLSFNSYDPIDLLYG